MLHKTLGLQDLSIPDSSTGKGVGQQTGELPKGDAETYPGLTRGRLLHTPENASGHTWSSDFTGTCEYSGFISESTSAPLCHGDSLLCVSKQNSNEHLWLDLGIQRNVTNSCSNSLGGQSDIFHYSLKDKV